jgi:DNA-binding transcriptional ArsR family regulator
MAAMDEVALKAVANARRREILRLVWTEERPSGEIASHFDVSWPAISQNLRVLEHAGLVRVRRRGTTRYYRADHVRLRPLKKLLETMWRDDLDRLAGLAEAEARQSKAGRK